jgi:hypothetical protein
LRTLQNGIHLLQLLLKFYLNIYAMCISWMYLCQILLHPMWWTVSFCLQ